jgi:hypothetical protein
MILKYKNHFNRIKKSVEYKRKNWYQKLQGQV